MNRMKVKSGMAAPLLLAAMALGAFQADAAWTYDSSAGTLSDDSGTVLAVSVVTKYDVTGLQVNSVTSLGTNTDIDFTGFSTPDDGYRVISFGVSAFNKNKQLTSVVAPDVINVGNNAMLQCHAVTNIAISADVRYVGGQAFQSMSLCNDFSPSVFNELETIPTKMFFGTTLKNTTLEFPKVTTVGDNAFDYYGVNIPEADRGPRKIVMTNVVTVGGSAFWGRYNTEFDGNLPHLVINSTAKAGQFQNLKMYDAYMPGVTVVPEKLFYDCKSLTNIVLSSDIEYIGPYAFAGCPIDINPLLTKKLVTICPSAFQSTATPSIVFDCPQIDCLTNNIFFTCGKTTNVVIKSHVNKLCGGSLTGLAGGVSIWFENGAPSVVATNAITYLITDRARAKVYVRDSDLAASGFASQLEPVDAADKTHRGKDVNNNLVYDWPGKRVRGKVKGWYKWGDTFRLSYYYVVGYPLGGIVIFQ